MRAQPARPSVSVIVPIHNAEKYLDDTVRSIMNQTLSGIEIILVDDRSSDGSLDVCYRLAREDPRICVLRNRGKVGVSATRNRGIERAKGRYIAFVDHDDFIDPDMYLVMYEATQNGTVDLVDCSFKRVSVDGKTEQVFCNTHPRGQLLDRGYILSSVLPTLVGLEVNPSLFIGNTVWNKIFRRDMIHNDDIRFDEGRMKFEDRLFVVEFLKNASTIKFVDDAFYCWIRRPNSLLTRYDPDEFFAVVSNQLRYRELYGQDFDFDAQDAVVYRVSAVMETIRSIVSREHGLVSASRLTLEILNHPSVREWYAHLDVRRATPTQLAVKGSLAVNVPRISCVVLVGRFFAARMRRATKKLVVEFASSRE